MSCLLQLSHFRVTSSSAPTSTESILGQLRSGLPGRCDIACARCHSIVALGHGKRLWTTFLLFLTHLLLYELDLHFNLLVSQKLCSIWFLDFRSVYYRVPLSFIQYSFPCRFFNSSSIIHLATLLSLDVPFLARTFNVILTIVQNSCLETLKIIVCAVLMILIFLF